MYIRIYVVSFSCDVDQVIPNLRSFLNLCLVPIFADLIMPRNDSIVLALDTSKIAQNVFYILIGCFIVGANAVVCATIIFNSKLRSRTELVIIAALMFSEMLCGLAYFTGGIWRLVAALNPSLPMITPRQCFLAPHISLFIVAPLIMTLMELIVSIDRLICVICLTKYSSLGCKYLCFVLLPSALVVLASYAWSWMSTFSIPDKSNVDPACMLNASVSKTFYLYYNVVQVFSSAASVLIYCFVISLFSVMKPTGNANAGLQARRLQRQRKITKTLGMMSFVCMVTYMAPQLTITLFGSVYNGPATLKNEVIVYMRIIMALYSAINVTIYLSRPSDVTSQIRVVLLKVFCCKTVSPSNRVSPSVVESQAAVKKAPPSVLPIQSSRNVTVIQF